MRVQVSLRAPAKGTALSCPFFFALMLLNVKRINRNLASAMEIRAYVIVNGLVQGVGYRYFVFNQATSLGLVGYVRNIFSGEVEIEIEGDRSLIEEFINEVKVGPRVAHVTDVKIEWLKCTKSYRSFEIR
jgi:acylphosphatase